MFFEFSSKCFLSKFDAPEGHLLLEEIQYLTRQNLKTKSAGSSM